MRCATRRRCWTTGSTMNSSASASAMGLRTLLAIALLGALPALAQEWPARPIKMIVPFPPGGGTDTVARPLAAKLSEILGQQVVIDNRGGAGGTIGAAVVAK